MSNSPFNSLGFHPIIEHWFKNCFAAPNPPQKSGWPSIAAGNHTLILAPTGSGKTLTAFLWSIDQLFRKSLKMDARKFDQNPSGVHTLYISPPKNLLTVLLPTLAANNITPSETNRCRGRLK